MARNETDERGPADEALAAAARAGDRAAFAELWRRHAGAGLVAARQYAQIADADDLLSEASLRIFAALRRGNGPHGAFRPYLYRTIRNIALDWRRPPTVALEDAPEEDLALPGPELAAVERALGFRAFRSLPERWQTVLWYLEIEGMEPAQAAPLLGLSPNATSALALRAREGLKKAWLQAHVNETAVPEGCRWTTARMGEYSRGGLTRRGRERFAAHLATCERCTALLDEIEDASGRLAVLVLPLLLGGSAAAALLARRAAEPDASADGPAADPALGSAQLGRGLPGPTGSPLLAAGAGVVAIVVVVAGIVTAVALTSEPAAAPSPPGASSPAPTEAPATPTPTPTPTQAEPEDEPVPPWVPPRTVPPLPPVVPPPVVPPPVAPAAPAIDFDPSTGRIAVTGAGDVPGATIEVWGTTISIVTGIVSPPTLLASAVVAPDGSWTTPQAGGLTPINVTVVVVQVRDGSASDPVELITEAIFNAETVSTVGAVAGGTATWQLLGWAGATWEIREPGGGATVAAGTFAADGTATATVALPGAPSGTVLDYDYGYVMEDGMAASSPGLSVTVP